MSAALKATSILGGLAVFATATLCSTRQTSDFSSSALAAAEHSATEISAVVKPKLPSNLFQFTRGDFKIGNVRA
ncbi:hypothetical protein LTR35_016037 [Friedmanniomyces endolithicus]|uniref:Uncharacterized protein n=1 Tax=Friedmanniomyces endolithicus TaxID=329885 RepID=A0AAN6FHQ8_9PEZI|nr:hypothetical protein LTR35_016037 [Friedmanniomyces endolithicus]KAK0271686.1 hypothetical protein LTS00_016525 [Friedmanniomyces endolithicus]KAK0317429.1 hypothetical protein LTR82_011467 [Friedmanniomyces endolithicus]KAK1006209.1 hypothetical protein LTR54_006732 [Friedmanniomyces endolithicus]